MPQPHPSSFGDSPIRELDLRSEQPPVPFQRALEALGTLGRSEHLVIHTRLRPTYLFDYLANLPIDHDCEERDAGHWVTTLWRTESSP